MPFFFNYNSWIRENSDNVEEKIKDLVSLKRIFSFQ